MISKCQIINVDLSTFHIKQHKTLMKLYAKGWAVKETIRKTSILMERTITKKWYEFWK